MKAALLMVLITGVLVLGSCGASKAVNVSNSETPSPETAGVEGESAGGRTSVEPVAAKEPGTVLEFFELLTDEYFLLEGCDRSTDKGCRNARREYLKTFTEVMDIRNGYFKGGCDGAQACIEMTIFRRPNGRYLVAVATFQEMMNTFHFIDHSDGRWTDVGDRDVPEFGDDKWYELPRFGTTMNVYEKRVVERGDDYEITDRGRKLYQLIWKDGKFHKQGS